MGWVKPAHTYLYMSYEEKQIKSNVIYEGKILTLKVDDIQTHNGRFSKREYVVHRGGAGVLAIDENDYVYLVRQYRYAYREELLEIPAGKLEEGESPLTTVRRELEEETGLHGDIREFGLLYPTPGYTNEPLYIFVATNLKQSERHPDEGEFLDVVRISFDEVYEMVMSGKIRDAKTAYAVLKYHALRLENKKP